MAHRVLCGLSIMNSPLPWFACLSAAIGALSMDVASARACADEAERAWLPERSWPAACERDIPTDGLVVLEGPARASHVSRGKGDLRVQIKRMLGGTAVETFEGNVIEVGPNAAVFRSKVPLSGDTDYVLTAQRVSSDGTPLSAPFTSAFTTGHTALPSLAFRSVPTIQLEAFDKELEHCEAAEACGDQRCTPTGETAPTHYLRISVPEIDGGLTKLPYSVSATLTSDGAGETAVLATQEAPDVRTGLRSYMLLELPPRDRDGRGCVTVSATDAAGHQADAETVCLALPASDAPPPPTPAQPEHLDALRLATPAAPDESATATGGCTIARGASSTSDLLWLALVLAMMRPRARKRDA
jgi:hypothetical protein